VAEKLAQYRLKLLLKETDFNVLTLRERLEKTNSAPFSRTSPSSLRAIAYNPVKLLRRSTGSTASTTLRL
jgi:hypothetical protein